MPFAVSYRSNYAMRVRSRANFFVGGGLRALIVSLTHLVCNVRNFFGCNRFLDLRIDVLAHSRKKWQTLTETGE